MKKKKKIYFLYVVAALLTIITVIVFSGPFMRRTPSYAIELLLNDWDVVYKEKFYGKTTLAGVHVGNSKAGDTLEATHELPLAEVPNACVRLSTVLCALDVYVDDVLIYTYGHDWGKQGRLIPIRAHFVALPEGYAGRELRIEMKAYKDGTMAGLSSVSIGNRTDIQFDLLQEYRLPLFAGIFLIMFGFSLIVTSVYLIMTEMVNARIYFSAAVLLLLGFYILGFYDLVDFLTNRPDVRTVMEYGSLYLLPAATSAFVANVMQGKVKRILQVVAWLNLLLAIIVFILHGLNIVLLFEFLPLFQAMILVGSVSILLYVIRLFLRHNTKTRRKIDASYRSAELVLLGGIAYLFTAAPIDLLRYLYIRYVDKYGAAYLDITTVTHGALIFAGCLLVNYFYYSVDYLNGQLMVEKMEGLAYTDTLTGLANRARCEAILQRLNGKKEPYTIISLDLNGLKTINDTKGHVFGDKLLHGFADILNQSFGKEAVLVGRMGGDEFLVAFRNIPYHRVQELVGEFDRQMQLANEKEPELQYDAAWGIASSDEMSAAVAWKVYMLADERMYDNKKARKRALELAKTLEGGTA